MLTSDDLQSFEDVSIRRAEIRERPGGGSYLRLHLVGGGVLAISPAGDSLTVADESSID
jgi:hypothetical protein